MSPLKTPSDIAAQQRAYRPVVLKDLIDSEKTHITELQHLMSNVLSTIEKSEMLVTFLSSKVFLQQNFIISNFIKIKVLLFCN